MTTQAVIQVLTAVSGIVLGAGGSLLGVRAKLKAAKVSADKAQTQYLEDRIASLSKMYEEQGKALDDVRSRVLELAKAGLDKDERISQLEAENRKLVTKVTKLEKELATYRTKSAKK